MRTENKVGVKKQNRGREKINGNEDREILLEITQNGKQKKTKGKGWRWGERKDRRKD
jgi:hypothetical protein